jgi:hypothetical protein
MDFDIILYSGGILLGYYFLGRGTKKILKFIDKIKETNHILNSNDKPIQNLDLIKNDPEMLKNN